MNASYFTYFLQKWRENEATPFTVNETTYLIPCVLLATIMVFSIVVGIAKLVNFHANQASRGRV
jgi:hypothetical protein